MSAAPSDPSASPAAPGPAPVDPSRKYWWAAAVVVPVMVALIGVVPSFLGGSAPPAGTTSISNTRLGDDLYFVNRSETLTPDLLLFDHQQNQVARVYRTTAGASLDATAEVAAPGTWYVQFKAWSSGSGEYTLLLEQ